MLKTLTPPLLLLAFLGLVGFYVWYSGQPVFMPGFMAIMLFYAVIFGLGIYASRFKKTENSDDVILAGRSLPLYVAVFTMSATWIDGGYINGTAESSASSGLMWVQAPWGYAMSLMIGGLFFAKKMRAYKFTTMLDPLEKKFGKRMTGLLFLPALSGEIFWTAAILTALGTTFSTVLGVDFTTAVLISAFIAIIYTSIGGLWAMAFTDVFQMIFIIVGLAVVTPFVVSSAGGLSEVWSSYVAEKGDLASPFPSRQALGPYWWNWWDNAFLLMFGGIPWQVYFQRVLAAKDDKTAVRLSLFAGILCLIVAVPAALIGIAGHVFEMKYTWASVGAPALESASKILPYSIRYLTPPYIATIGLGVVAAAVMSSVDASILSASSMASWNIWKPLVRPKITPIELSKIVKRCIWIVGITATIMALQVKSVYALWFLCSDFVYCLLFPQLVCALFDKKANVIGSLAGFIVSFVLRFGGGDITLGITRIIPYPMIAGDGSVLFPFRTLAMLSGLVTIFLVSRLSQKWYPAKSLG